MKQSVKEVIKYGAVGLTGIAVEWLTFFLFRDVLDIRFGVAHVMSLVCGASNNFVLNCYFTFKTTDRLLKRATSFFSIASVGWILNSFIILGTVFIFENYLHDILEIRDDKEIQNIAKLTATVIIAGLQFFANKYFTFKKR